MARKPTPTHLKLLSGNPGRRPINDAEPQFEVSIKEIEPPKELGKIAKKMWASCIKEIPDDLIKKIDAPELMRYCIAFELYTKAYDMIKKEGAVFISKLGEPKPNPWVNIMNQQATIMTSAGSNLGFSPASRSKIKIQNSEKNKKNKFSVLDGKRA